MKKNKNTKSIKSQMLSEKAPARNALHFDVQLNTRATATKNKKRVIPRKQKNNRIEY